MIEGLRALDLLVVATYLGAVVGMSIYFARRQRTGDDYFLAGRSMGGPLLAMSILANQASAVSLIGAPAFVALREGGGLRWLQYELALPLAMLALIAVLLPALRSVPGASIYAYPDRRFGPGTRRALASAFLLSRGLSVGVILYASSLVVAKALGVSLEAALILLGLFSVFYTSLGGIVADIWSDALQLVLLWGGTLVSALFILEEHGLAVLRAIPPERTRALVADATALDAGGDFTLWPMLLGGLFLYVSYYGCDQSQAQRLLASRDDRSARRALALNGLLRFPLVLTYCGFGLLLAGLLRVDPTFAASMQGQPADSLVPTFMMSYLPAGLRGLLLAAILAAAMSSIDSALNSLAAVTLEDVFDRPSSAQGVWLSRGVSLLWGLFAVGSGLAFSRGSKGVLELVNQVGSAFYGPVLAVFVVGALLPAVTGRGALIGLGAGLAANASLASAAPQVSWLWWNPVGFLAAVAASMAATRPWPKLHAPAWPRGETALLAGAFVVMFGLLAALSSF
ncbi:MAG TPA: sodium/solute symporter [Vicinamibacteria bacterium]|nr:sodium/solute symporter [Vicinamibacteria bacterium]